MAISLYTIPNWSTNQNYSLWDIVNYNGLYYYCNFPHNSSLSFNSDYWDGIIAFNSINKPYFQWIPSYGSEISVQPTIREVKFGDGYRQVSSSEINNDLLSINLSFDLRTDAEAKSILHFLHARKGAESFVFIPQEPYNQQLLFTCKTWTPTKVFVNNNLIRCIFEQSAV